MGIVHITDSTFEQEVIQSDLPVLVDYWAEWCGPCKALAPVLEQIEKDNHGKLKIAKLNIDENQDMPLKYNVRGIPTLILFNKGEVVGIKVGALSKGLLQEFIDENLA